MLPKPRRVRIVERKLGRERALGQAIGCPVYLVEIDPRQSERERLDTLIHELLHLAHPSWSERRVETHATWLAALLWRSGYRRLAR